MKRLIITILIAGFTAVVLFAGCEKRPATEKGTPAGTHSDHDGHDHSTHSKDDGHGH